LDQRMLGHDAPDAHQQRDTSPVQLPALPAATRAGVSPARARGVPGSKASTAAARCPIRSAPNAVPPMQRGHSSGTTTTLKLDPVRGATGGRGSSVGSSSSGGGACDAPPSSARHQQQLLPPKPGKQGKLVNLSRAPGSAPDRSHTHSPRKGGPAAAGLAAAATSPGHLPPGPWPSHLAPPGGGLGPNAAGYGLNPAGMMQGLPAGAGFWPGGYWMAPGSAGMPSPGRGQSNSNCQPGAAWPEGPVSAAAQWPGPHTAGSNTSTAGGGYGSSTALQQQHAAWQRQHEATGSTWQQQQQQMAMWWGANGQMMPPQQPQHPHMQQQQYQHSPPGWPGASVPGHPPEHHPYHAGANASNPMGAPGPYPSTPGYSSSMMGYPQGPCAPLTAPTGLTRPPGSPLLPTLHYQETVMRNRTSSRGSEGPGACADMYRGADGSSGSFGGGGSRWGSAGSGVGSGSTCSSRGQGGGEVHMGGAGGSGWASKVSREAANVWPPRGVERSILTGLKGSGRRGDQGQGGGDIVVYNPHLLLS
jgi:hypothetical protein